MARSSLPFYSAVALLWPVLIVQGKWTRWVTPKLPEASGDRIFGRDDDPPLKLLIAGDSAAAGVGVEHQNQALSGQLFGQMAEDSIRIQLLAETGRDAREVCELLEQSKVADFDAVVFSVGVNDVTGLTSMKRWSKDLNTLYEWAKAKNPKAQVIFSELPPMHAFLALPQPLRWVLGQRAKLLQDALEQWALAMRDCDVLKSDFPIQADFLASDGFHPGAKAYTVWARAVAKRLSGFKP